MTPTPPGASSVGVPGMPGMMAPGMMGAMPRAPYGMAG